MPCSPDLPHSPFLPGSPSPGATFFVTSKWVSTMFPRVVQTEVYTAQRSFLCGEGCGTESF